MRTLGSTDLQSEVGSARRAVRRRTPTRTLGPDKPFGAARMHEVAAHVIASTPRMTQDASLAQST
jgi:hypothetical protein